MVLTRSTKNGSTPLRTKSKHTPGPSRPAPATDAGPVTAGAAYTLPIDEERMREFRAQFLSNKRTWRHWVRR